MWDDLVDLVAGAACVVCLRPGRPLCRTCDRHLPRSAATARPTPCPPGLLPVWAAGEYAGALRSLVLQHKEHAVHALARPLGRVLAESVAAAVHALEGPGPSGAGGGRHRVVLVPVPSHPRRVRERGHDPLLRAARCAAGELRRRGVAATVARPLRTVGAPADQSGLDARARAANLAGALTARPGPPSYGPVVVVDDVLTTGATLRSAQVALVAAGWEPVAAAVVAATRRRVLSTTPAPELPVPLPRSRSGH